MCGREGLARSGPARKKKKELFQKISKFSANFLYYILINSGLYFYTVKIQIRYENTRFSAKHKKYISCFHTYGQVSQ